MRKTKAFYGVLLLVFLSFLVTQYTSENTKALNLHESKAITAFNGDVQDLPLKDDNKKHPFTPINILQFFIYLSLVFISFNVLLGQTRNKLIFFTPIFYQANYLIRTP
ncbi:hypothetical protein [Peribacillus asahii]|uniref:hypothetical protein n=1 Tax=Peribacillus asahii TaxID=228899 RepID=UPI003816FEED